MKKYLLKRFIYIIVVFFIVSLLMYMLYNLIPSNPALAQMEPLRKTMKPNDWNAKYLALREEMGLDDPLLLRYARWIGFAKRRDSERFHFVEADKMKNGKRYIMCYTDGTTEYIIGCSYAGQGDYEDQFIKMVPITVDGDKKLDISPSDVNKYGASIRKFLFAAEGSSKDGWVFKNADNGFYLVFNEDGQPAFADKLTDGCFKKWNYGPDKSISNIDWKGNDTKYLNFMPQDEEKTIDNYVGATDSPKAAFKLYEIKDMRFYGMLEGNFGQSIKFKKSVVDCIGTPMLNSIILNVASTVLALAITIPLGIYCAVHARKVMDTTIQAVTVIGQSMPSFITAILFIYVFAVLLRIFPVGGAKTPGSTLTGAAEFADRMYYMLLPILTMVFMSLAGMTRMVRASMLDCLSQDYIRTARAKGLKEKVVIYSHAWRNALLPVSTSVIGSFIGVFTGGSLIIERTFALNGTGALYMDALITSDFELVLALQMFYEIVSLLGVLLTDVSYTLIDPRVRISK